MGIEAAHKQSIVGTVSAEGDFPEPYRLRDPGLLDVGSRAV